ncbi:MAG: TonB-dependent siderophore receptor [Rhodanobacter sp.]
MPLPIHFPHIVLASVLLSAMAPTGVAMAGDTETPQQPHAASTRKQATELRPVTVTARGDKGYHANVAQLDTFGSFGHAPLQDTPAAVTVITRAQIDDRQPRTLSELARGDAALGDNYAPVGYYQDISIRGFPLDLATGYRLNDMSLVGEQPIALEDKQRVEILKGLGGLEAGVLAPAGLVNYVSKRPADVHTATLGTDSHGSRYLATDIGGWLSPEFGVRINAAHETMHSYVQHANGRRSFLSLAADWRIAAKTTLQFDTDYLTSGQRSVSGYQLLGGTTVPPHPSRTRMLGFEPWQQPVGIDASNSTLRLNQRLDAEWNAQLSASHSRSTIDDNVAFAYGCFYAPACASGSPGYFFAPNGDYDVYDFRSPDDNRRNDELRAVLQGTFRTGVLEHELTVGASVFHRTLDQRPYVYDYVGTANINEAEPPYFAPSPNQPGLSARTLSSWQRTAFALDRVHLNPHWQVLAGGRLVRLHELAYDETGASQRDTRLVKALPQTALMWEPTSSLTAYLSYSENLALGNQAPYWTSNGNATLAPLLARQSEAGVKYAWNPALSLQAALYQITQPHQFAQPDATPAGFTFVQHGNETHTGMEVSAIGQVTGNLRLTASVNLIRAQVQDTATPGYDGHQVVNVPKLRSALYVDYRLPFASSVSLLAGWRHASSNPATPDGATRVPGYSVFDTGLRYITHLGQHALTWRLNIDNVFDHFYWRDTGNSGGDSYLFPGAPRLARLSVTMDF